MTDPDAPQRELDDDARLECRICWYLYDPALGDPTEHKKGRLRSRFIEKIEAILTLEHTDCAEAVEALVTMTSTWI